MRYTVATTLSFVLLIIAAGDQSDPLQVIILSDPPVTFCINETVVLTCQVFNVTQPVYKWFSTKTNISHYGSTLKVIATDDLIEYYCNVFDNATNSSGQGEIGIVNKGMPPVLYKTNFKEVVRKEEGNSLNLTVEILTSAPLIGEPTWSRLDDKPLSPKAIVRNFVVNEHDYTSLGISNLSFANDSGNYSLTTTNLCGESILTIYVDVKGPHVCPSVDPVPKLIHGCINAGAIDGDVSSFLCSFEASYDDFVKHTDHYWTIKIKGQKSIKVNETSTFEEYFVTVYPECILHEDPCCIVTTELLINRSSIAMNGTVIMCYAGLSSFGGKEVNSSANLTVFERPSLIIPPTNKTVKEYGDAQFQCHFKASTRKYVTITEWFKDGHAITNTNRNKYQVVQGPDSQENNVVFSMLHILNVSKSDEGKYSCYCYYNKTILVEYHIYDTINSTKGQAILKLQEQENNENTDSVGFILSVVAGTFILGIVVIILGFLKRSISKLETEDNKSVLKPEVKIVKASSLPSATEIIYESDMFDERGGIFHSTKHGVTVVFPAGAIPKGYLVEFKFAARLNAPVKFSDDKILTSTVFWLCMNAELQVPIKLYLPHAANIENEAHASNLQFVKFQHLRMGETMEIIEGGKFPIGESYGFVEVDHFCYYCIAKDKLDPSDIPHNKYAIAAITNQESNLYEWEGHICLYPMLPTCSEKLKEQYNCKKEWRFKPLSQFSFADGSSQVKIELEGDNWEGKAKIVNLNDDMIQQKDIDFHCYYKSDKLKDELKFKMDNLLYPPRVEFKVNTDTDSFFRTPKTVIVKFHGIVKTDNSELPTYRIVIPATVVFTDSSDSATRERKDSGDDYIKALLDENSFISGKVRDLMIKTAEISSKWFKLGFALMIPIDTLERLYDKYNDKPGKALARVYYHWLVDDPPTPEEKLIKALKKIKEYASATELEKDLNPQQFISSNQGESDDPEKNLVMAQIPGQLKLLNFRELVPVLSRHKLLTQHETYDLLNDHISQIQRANALVYTILPTKGPGAYRKFIKSIHEETEHEGHRELAKILPLNC